MSGLIVTSIEFVIYGSQSVIAVGMITADVDVDEAEMAGNATNMTMADTNQTESQNMTGMINNSTG